MAESERAASATGICLLLFALVELLPQPIIGVFTGDRELIALATRAARLVFAGLALVGFIMVGSLTFQAIGLAGRSFLTAIARPVLFLIPALLVLPHYLGLDGVWLVFPVSDLLTFLLTLALLLPQLRWFRRMAV
jgi:Na+-driven multidrug efflux pump